MGKLNYDLDEKVNGLESRTDELELQMSSIHRLIKHLISHAPKEEENVHEHHYDDDLDEHN